MKIQILNMPKSLLSLIKIPYNVFFSNLPPNHTSLLPIP